MSITSVTRAALASVLRDISWGSRMDDATFLARLYPIDTLPSSDPRFPTAREDIWQHTENNVDWDDDWVMQDDRFLLNTRDDKLLEFLAETAHPEVRSNPDEGRLLVERYNELLRLDGVELYAESKISGRPLYGWRAVPPPMTSPVQIRDAIADALYPLSANQELEDYVESLGLGRSDGPDDDPMKSKRRYVKHHLRGCSPDEILTIAHRVLDDYEDQDLRNLVEGFDGAVSATSGPVKQLIFAADGPKPELVLRDALTNDIEITKYADKCLVYDRPISSSGVSLRDLIRWWQDIHAVPDQTLALQQLHDRLKRSVSVESPGEQIVFAAYATLYRNGRYEIPALIPQVYLHLDPRTRRHIAGPLTRQRMDFLLLLPRNRRIVIEVDGQTHYTDPSGKPSPARYAEMVREDRKLRLAGYEIYRFGGAEMRPEPAASAMVIEFFVALLGAHGITVKPDPR